MTQRSALDMLAEWNTTKRRPVTRIVRLDNGTALSATTRDDGTRVYTISGKLTAIAWADAISKLGEMAVDNEVRISMNNRRSN